MVHRHTKYDLKTGAKRLRNRLAIAFTSLTLVAGGTGLSLALTGAAHASSSDEFWMLNAPQAITFNCGGSPYAHTLDTVSEDLDGNFTGTGTYDADHSYTWDISGDVNHNNISFTLDYTGTNAGYTLHGHGSVASDGSISGTVDNNCQTFSMGAGSATLASNQLDAKQNLKRSQCEVTSDSTKVVDVKFRLINDYDSAVGGTNWANDTINRHLRIWEVSDGTYCAITNDDGSFVTMSGNSPNGTGSVGSGIHGDMFGGKITGVLSGSVDSSAYKKHGNLGTFNLDCNQNASGCNSFPSVSSYVSNYGDQLSWWGWEYDTCQNGSWINSSDANLGDITGNAPTGRDRYRCHDDNDHHHHNSDRHYRNDNRHHCGPRR